jgi:hypothetical protein
MAPGLDLVSCSNDSASDGGSGPGVVTIVPKNGTMLRERERERGATPHLN